MQHPLIRSRKWRLMFFLQRLMFLLSPQLHRFLSTEATFPDSSSLPASMTPSPTQPPLTSSSTLEHITMSELMLYAHHLAHSPRQMAKQHRLGQPTRPLKPVNDIPPPSSNPLLIEYDSGEDSEEESPTFDALISAHYKKVAHHIHPVRTTLPEEYH